MKSGNILTALWILLAGRGGRIPELPGPRDGAEPALFSRGRSEA